jgi:hypothetical protein
VGFFVSLVPPYHSSLEHQDDQILRQTLEGGIAKGIELVEFVKTLHDAKYPLYKELQRSRLTEYVEDIQRSLWGCILPCWGSK